MSETTAYDYDEEEYAYQITCKECETVWFRETDNGAKGIRKCHELHNDHTAEITKLDDE